MTDSKHETVIAAIVAAGYRQLRVVGASRVPVKIDPTFKIIGTSGSTDYLRDTGNRRYWWVGACNGASVPVLPTQRGDLAETNGAHDEPTEREEID